MVTEVVLEDDLCRKIFNRSDWLKFANGMENDRKINLKH